MVDYALRIKLMEKTKREAEYYRSYANFLEDYGVQLRHKVNTPKKLVNIYHERKPTPPPGSRVDDYFKTLTSAAVCSNKFTYHECNVFTSASAI